MFSPRIKLALCILHELAKQKETGVKLTLSVLKQTLGPLFTTREAAKVARDLCNASLAGYERKDDHPGYFYSNEAEKATLYDLIIAIEGLTGLSQEFAAGYLLDFPDELAVAAFIEERLDFEAGEALKKIPLSGFLPGEKTS